MQQLGITPADVQSAPHVDVVAASMTINATRKQAIDFSEVYYDAGQRVLVYRTSQYQGIQDLSGRPVCSVKGSTSEQNAKQANPYIDLESQPFYADCLRDMEERKVSAITTDDVILSSLKQMNPTIEDLTARATRLNPQQVEYPLGSWAPGETRDYQIDLSVPSGALGEEMLAMRPSIVFSQAGQDQELRSPEGHVVITWTTDEGLSSRINPRVAHYTGQEELAQAIEAGLEARERGDDDTATQMLGKAVKIAAESDNDEMTARLRRVVDVEDAATGTVRLKRSVDKAAAMDLELESTTTKRAARRPVVSP